MKMQTGRGANRRLAGAFSSGATTAAFMNSNVPTPIPTYEPVSTQITADTSGVPASSLTSPTPSGLMASPSGEASQLATAAKSGTVDNSSGVPITVPAQTIGSIISGLFGSKTGAAGSAVAGSGSGVGAMSPLLLLVLAAGAVYLVSRKT